MHLFCTWHDKWIYLDYLIMIKKTPIRQILFFFPFLKWSNWSWEGWEILFTKLLKVGLGSEPKSDSVLYTCSFTRAQKSDCHGQTLTQGEATNLLTLPLFQVHYPKPQAADQPSLKGREHEDVSNSFMDYFGGWHIFNDWFVFLNIRQY